MISYALRQEVLATALGLRYQMNVRLTDPSTFSQGGWIFLELASTDAWVQAATADQIRLYAARLPVLAETRRQVFAAILFPVDAVGIDDGAFGLAETYDDGFAQIVHVHQPQASSAVIGDGTIPAGTDVGVQIGWDDEQVVAWHNGQIQILNDRLAGKLNNQTPLGVSGYRVDVADITSSPAVPVWHSLVRHNRVTAELRHVRRRIDDRADRRAAAGSRSQRNSRRCLAAALLRQLARGIARRGGRCRQGHARQASARGKARSGRGTACVWSKLRIPGASPTCQAEGQSSTRAR